MLLRGSLRLDTLTDIPPRSQREALGLIKKWIHIGVALMIPNPLFTIAYSRKRKPNPKTGLQQKK
ncbi:hypothetical protein BVX98_02045 [bacterium F11]|nr:hypothetical protein BVX98_02045 [bacterium F11]